MANRFTVTSGSATAASTWNGGATVPVSGDRVLITHKSLAKGTLFTNAAGYSAGATVITLVGTTATGSFVTTEKVQFTGDAAYYEIMGWNNATKALTISPGLLVAIPAVSTRVISRGHVLTLDTSVTWGDDSTATSGVVINGLTTTRSITFAGTLLHSTTANTSLSLRGSLQMLAGSYHEMGTLANPVLLPYTAEVFVNASSVPLNAKFSCEIGSFSNFSYVGAYRNRNTVLTTAAAPGDAVLYVEDATGWQPGDFLIIASDVVKITMQAFTISASYTPGSLTVPIDATMGQSRRLGMPISNASSNVSIQPASSTYKGGWGCTIGNLEIPYSRTIKNVSFCNLYGNHPYASGAYFSTDGNYGSTGFQNPFTVIEDSAFYSNHVANSTSLNAGAGANPCLTTPLLFERCVLGGGLNGQNISCSVGVNSQVTLKQCVLPSATIISNSNYKCLIDECTVIASSASSTFLGGNAGTGSITLRKCTFGGPNYSGIHHGAFNVYRARFEECDFGVKQPYGGARNGYVFAI